VTLKVVMIRRLPEIHKANALKILYGKTSYDALHELPHGDFLVSALCGVCFVCW
jgi:hypothetical protein